MPQWAQTSPTHAQASGESDGLPPPEFLFSYTEPRKEPRLPPENIARQHTTMAEAERYEKVVAYQLSSIRAKLRWARAMIQGSLKRLLFVLLHVPSLPFQSYPSFRQSRCFPGVELRLKVYSKIDTKPLFIAPSFPSPGPNIRIQKGSLR
eukprot:82365-Hanusia_phi.AAC.1